MNWWLHWTMNISYSHHKVHKEEWMISIRFLLQIPVFNSLSSWHHVSMCCGIIRYKCMHYYQYCWHTYNIFYHNIMVVLAIYIVTFFCDFFRWLSLWLFSTYFFSYFRFNNVVHTSTYCSTSIIFLILIKNLCSIFMINVYFQHLSFQFTLVGWTCCVAFCRIWTTWVFIKLRALDKHCLNLVRNTGDSLYLGWK